MARRDSGLSPLLTHALLGIFTATGTNGDGAGLERFLPPGSTTLCGYGRQALAIALGRVGVAAGDTVLVPGFVCREVLASVQPLGASVGFYDVDERLQVSPASFHQTAGSRVRAVIAVNYFGFPQPLEPVAAWCRANGAVLIEDNAHGFLSADRGVPLGRRGDFGIFSLRKTLALPNGAAVVDNRPGGRPDEGDARFRDPATRAELGWIAKRLVKRAMALGGPATVRPMIESLRRIRSLVTRSDSAHTEVDAEQVIPSQRLSSATPWLLRHVAVEKEIVRRRTLFRECRALLADDADVGPLFADLDGDVAPQGYPFMYRGRDPLRFMNGWWKRGVPMIRWPELPSAVESTAPPHYRRVMLVPFLW